MTLYLFDHSTRGHAVGISGGWTPMPSSFGEARARQPFTLEIPLDPTKSQSRKLAAIAQPDMGENPRQSQPIAANRSESYLHFFRLAPAMQNQRADLKPGIPIRKMQASRPSE